MERFKNLERYDQSGMLDRLAKFPDQCRKALDLGHRFDIPEDFSDDYIHLITAGMGGSGITGFLLKRFLDIPVFVNRGYHLPKFATKSDLLIAISYSGNAEETISSLNEGLNRGMNALLISSGGELKRISEEKGLPLIKIPPGLQPRAAMGYLFLPLLKILSRLKIFKLKSEDLDDLDHTLKRSSSNLNKSIDVPANPAKVLARKLLGKIPLIYGTDENTEVVAQRWKTQFNENSKQPAFWNVIPELDHNELVGFTNKDLLANCRVIFLRNSYDLARNQKRISIMKSIFTKSQIGFEEVKAEGENELSQILAQIYMGDFTSVYLALLNQVDPTPVALIEDFKNRMVK